ncbi:CYP505, partial [Symbiodinium microadriaticum]
YMFWNKAQRRSEQACAKMKEIAEQVLTMSRDRARSKHCIDASMDTANQTEQASSEGSKVKSVGGDGAEPNGEALNGSILHRILEHDYPSDAHRVSEIISFIVAGHETSAFTLCFFLFEMARNPGELKKVQHELDEVITAETCPNGRPTLAQ